MTTTLRIRTIKPSFYTDERLFDLEQRTGLPVMRAFPGLWSAADREGRFNWRPRTLRALLMPFDELDYAEILDALWSAGFIDSYEVNGERFGVIPGFKDHQRVNKREAQSVIPAPNDNNAIKRPPLHVHARALQVHAPGEGKGREGKEASQFKDLNPRSSLPSDSSTRQQGLTVSGHRSVPWVLVGEGFKARRVKHLGEPEVWYEIGNFDATFRSIARKCEAGPGGFRDTLDKALDGFFADDFAQKASFPAEMFDRRFGKYYAPPQASSPKGMRPESTDFDPRPDENPFEHLGISA